MLPIIHGKVADSRPVGITLIQLKLLHLLFGFYLPEM
jgi:hypothetical protein